MERKGKLILLAFLFLGALISGYFAAQTYATYVLKEKFDRRLAKLPFPTAYRSFHYNLLKNDIEIEDLTVKDGGITLSVGELLIDLPYTLRKKELPPYFKVVARDVTVPSNAPFIGELLKFTGYTRPTIRLDFASSYRFENKGLEVQVDTVAAKLGALRASVELEGISRTLARKVLEGRIPPKILETRGELKELLITYKDYGLFKMFLNFVSSQEGESPEKVKEELKKTIYQAMREREEVARRIGLPLLLFVENPSCIELTVSPRPPVRLSELIKMASEKPDLEETLKRLNLELKTCR